MKPIRFIRLMFLPSVAGVLLAFSGSSLRIEAHNVDDPAGMQRIQTMNYHDFWETEALLYDLDNGSGYVDRRIIGYSFDAKSDPSISGTFPIYALRISADATDSNPDNYDKNGILFECGMHPREWLASESCLMLAQYLASNRTNSASGVPELLEHSDVWIIPITTPSGRHIDDRHGGDPTQFYNLPPWEEGWRGNGYVFQCDAGVNVARNFSRGFNDRYATVFCGKEYRGYAPFSSSEANGMREFVENHSISMAVVVHTNSQQIWNQWGSGDDAGERIIEEAARIWRQGWSAPADQTKYDLARESVGGGSGQFSAWLSKESENSGNETSETISPWAFSGDQPIAGDFDRDGTVDDVAVYRPSDHFWYYDHDHDGDTDDTFGPWAQVTSYRPFAGDFDRDGYIDDVAVLRLSDLSWHYDYDHNGTTDVSISVPGCGMVDYIPMAIDSDRDGYVDDRVAYRPSNRKWYYDRNHDCISADGSPIGPWGIGEDRPVAGDFDRDGKMDDVGVFRPSTQIWYYDENHDGNTDHASGPWGKENGLPVAGDFRRETEAWLDDVGIFNPNNRTWYYDSYHNATIKQQDEGSIRAIQTVYLELPFLPGNYDSPYRQSATDTSNSFHPSGDAVSDVINDSFIPMAKYLIRQSRSPGCPTANDGSAEFAYCPTQDFGLVTAKLIRDDDSLNSKGRLFSLPARRYSWSEIDPARMVLFRGDHKLVYRAQNFSDTTQSFKVIASVTLFYCSTPTSCFSSLVPYENVHNTVPSQGAVNGIFDLDLSFPTGYNGSYTVGLRVRDSSGNLDDFEDNDEKVFKFNTFFEVFLPMVMED